MPIQMDSPKKLCICPIQWFGHGMLASLRQPNSYKKWSLSIFLVVYMFLPCFSYSDDFDYKIKAGLREEYSDNVFFDEDKGMDAWSTVLMTQAILKNNTEILKTNLSGEWSRTVYDEYRDLNNDDWALKSRLIWYPGENTSYSLDLAVGEDSNIDTYLASTGILLDTKKHEYMKGDISLTHNLSERVSTELTMSYTDDSTESNDDGLDDFTLSSWGASAGMILTIDELTSLNLNSGFGLYDYDTSSVEQVYASLGLNRAVGETITFFCSMGSRYTTYTNDIIIGINMLSVPPSYLFGEKKHYSWGLIGKAGVVFKNEDSSVQLSVDENLQPSTGQAQSLERTSVDVSYHKQFTDDVTYRISALYRINRSDDEDPSETERTKTFGLSSSLSCLILDDLSLTGSYSFSKYRSETYQVQKNVYRVLLDYSF